MNNCFCFGKNAGIDLTDEEYMLCIKAEGCKEFRKKITPEQMTVIREIFFGETVTPEPPTPDAGKGGKGTG